jgi:hypothetical protein
MSISSGEDEFIKHIKPVRIQKLAITGLFPENDFTSPDPSKKRDMPKGRVRGKAVRGSKLPYRISVAGSALLYVYSLSQQDEDVSLRSFPQPITGG